MKSGAVTMLGTALLAAAGLGAFFMVRRTTDKAAVTRSQIRLGPSGLPGSPGALPRQRSLDVSYSVAPQVNPLVPVPSRKRKPRSPDEWQGMLVDQSLEPPCGRSIDCSFALACKHGKCGACEEDPDCGVNEVCVLDHCVLRSKATCRRRGDCSVAQICVLTGFSNDDRNNENMESVCLDLAGGSGRGSAALPSPEDSTPRPGPYDDELRRARGSDASR